MVNLINYFSDIFVKYNEINEDEDIFFLVKRNEDIQIFSPKFISTIN